MNEDLLRSLLTVGKIAAVIAGIIALIILLARKRGGEGQSRRTRSFTLFEPAYKRAGRAGEKAAVRAVSRVLRDEDRLFSNVEFEYDGRPCEIDLVIVNHCGVFIIEVKNYSGVLRGDEDDDNWIKKKTTRDGLTHTKTVINPVKQVKRQTYLLAHYLRYHGCDAWVDGYVWLIRGNSPVNGPFLLNSTDDVDRVIHASSKRPLSPDAIRRIAELLEDN